MTTIVICDDIVVANTWRFYPQFQTLSSPFAYSPLFLLTNSLILSLSPLTNSDFLSLSLLTASHCLHCIQYILYLFNLFLILNVENELEWVWLWLEWLWDWSEPYIVAEGTRWHLIIQLLLGGIYGVCGSNCREVSVLIVRAKPPDIREPPDDARVAGSAASEHTSPDDYSFGTVCSSRFPASAWCWQGWH